MRRSNKCNTKLNTKALFDLREKNINFCKDCSLFLSEAKYKAIYWRSLKILAFKQMLQRLPIALAQVKAVNTSEILINEIGQVIYSLYWATEITKKLYNDITNSIKLWNRVDTIFMNSENS